jgi:L-galactose dehydrogenase
MRQRPLGGTGLTVSELAFGTSPLGHARDPEAQRQAAAAVHTALELGITFFDTSPYYGSTRAERVLGTALLGVDRSSYVLATKVGRYGQAEFDFSARRVERSVHESLQRLGTDHLDLVQCHDIEFGDLDQVAEETVPALRALQAAGLVGAVGVTGYPLPALAHVARRVPVDTVLSYSQHTLQDRRLAAWRDRFAELGVTVIAAAPLAMGALTAAGPPAWHPAPAEVLRRCAAAAELCRARGTDLARIALQFAVATGDFATTVVGAAGPLQVRRNVAWTNAPMDHGLLRDVEECLAPVRDVGWSNGRPENQQPDGPR